MLRQLDNTYNHYKHSSKFFEKFYEMYGRDREVLQARINEIDQWLNTLPIRDFEDVDFSDAHTSYKIYCAEFDATDLAMIATHIALKRELNNELSATYSIDEDKNAMAVNIYVHGNAEFKAENDMNIQKVIKNNGIIQTKSQWHMDKVKLDEDIQFESEKGIRIDKYIKVEKGAVYNDQGYVTVNNYPDESTARQTAQAKDDEDIHMVIDNLYEAQDENGKKVFSDQSQWYAVYRVLKEYCNYPEKMTDFVHLIKVKNWAAREPLCKYESIKAVNNSLPLLNVKVGLWQQHSSVSEKYQKQCIVAEKLLKLLELI